MLTDPVDDSIWKGALLRTGSCDADDARTVLLGPCSAGPSPTKTALRRSRDCGINRNVISASGVGSRRSSRSANNDPSGKRPTAPPSFLTFWSLALRTVWTSLRPNRPPLSARFSFVDLGLIAAIFSAYFAYEWMANQVMFLVRDFMIRTLDPAPESAVLVTASSLLLAAVFFQALLAAVKLFVAAGYALRLRRALCGHMLLGKYYKAPADNLKANLLRCSGVDTVDGRISEDAREFCRLLPNFLTQCVILPGAIVYYSIQLYTREWGSPAGNAGICAALWGFWAVGAVLIAFLTRSVVPVRTAQQQREAEFRRLQCEQRLFTAEIVLLAGFRSEEKRSQQLFESLLKNQLRLVFWQDGGLAFANKLFAYLGTPICYLATGLVFLASEAAAKELDPVKRYSAMSMSVFLSMTLLGKFTEVVDFARDFSDMCGYAGRIRELEVVLDRSSSDNREGDESVAAIADESVGVESVGQDLEAAIADMLSRGGGHTSGRASRGGGALLTGSPSRLRREGACLVEVSGLDVVRQNVQLLRGVELTIRTGENTLLTGPSGCGKTSLLRLLAGVDHML